MDGPTSGPEDRPVRRSTVCSEWRGSTHPGWALASSAVESVSEVDLGELRWEPNAPAAVLVADDRGLTVLAVRAHPDDNDRRCVVFVWRGTASACMGGPNDERIEDHRLYDKGLSEVLWLGEVLAEPPDTGPPLHHVLPLKECVVEVLAREFQVLRQGEATLEAAVHATRR